MNLVNSIFILAVGWKSSRSCFQFSSMWCAALVNAGAEEKTKTISKMKPILNV